MEDAESFDELRERSEAAGGATFVVDLDGYEGPIDVLLMLAREHKLDLTRISILALADQYLAFVANARRTNLELAADYLVMAAWLAYLKSRLLLPDLGEEDEPTAEEMADALAFQLRRLEAMQDAGQKLMARAHLNREFFRRGAPETFRAFATPVYEVTLFDLLKAYGDQKKRVEARTTLLIQPWDIYTVEDALKRLRNLLGSMPDWASLWQFLPEGVMKGLVARSAMAATFAASLELVREGKIKLRQSGPFGPIYLKPAGDSIGGDNVDRLERGNA